MLKKIIFKPFFLIFFIINKKKDYSMNSNQNSLTPIHSLELSKNMGYTAYGIICQNAGDLAGKVFDNNRSHISLDFDDLIEKQYDEF